MFGKYFGPGYFSTDYFGQSLGDVLTAANFATASPVLDSPVLTQAQALVAFPLAVGVPTLGTAAATQGHSLAASAVSAGAPVLDVPALGIKVAAVASALTVSGPVVGASALGQSNVVGAVSLAVGAPAIGAGTFAQKHALATAALAISSPVIAAGSLAQKHVLAATGLAVGAPELAAGDFEQNYILDAVNVTTGAPVLGVTTITKQGHTFLPVAFASSAPVLGVGALKQKQVIVATGAVAGHPVVGVANFVQGGTCVALPLTVSAPQFSLAALKQQYKFAAVRLSLSSGAIIGVPKAVIKAPPLVAVSLTVQSPSISPLRPTVGFANLIATVPDFHVGRPEFSYPDAEFVGPPEVWFTCKTERWSRDPKAKFYDDDDTQFGRPVKQAIFTNLNDGIELTMSAGTLAGRTTHERGPAEDIIVGKPLWLADKKLRIDWSEVEQLREDVDALFEVASLNTETIAAHTAAIAINTAAVNANTAAVAANTALLAGLRADFEKLTRQLKVYIPRDLAAGAPVIGTPRASVKLPNATNLVASSPVLGHPTLVRLTI
jgi:hypothetical protein